MNISSLFPIIMFAFVVSQAAAYMKCPSVKQLSNSIMNVQTSDEWTYFYTSHLLDKDNLNFHLVSNSSLSLHIGSGLMCPDDKTEALFTTKEGMGSYSVNSNLGIVNFAVHNANKGQVDFVVSVYGENPNNYDSKTHIFFTALFLIACIVCIVIFFVHSIMARDKVHYQVEVEE